MLATACLIDEQDAEAMNRSADAPEVNPSTECISLSTNSFSNMSAEAQKHFQRAMEIHLHRFGRLYLAAMNLVVGTGDPHDACNAIEEALELLQSRVNGIIESRR